MRCFWKIALFGALVIPARAQGTSPSGPTDAAAETRSPALLRIEGRNVLSVTLEDGSGRIVALVASEDAQMSVYRPVSAGPRAVTDRILLPQEGTVPLAPGRYRWNSVIGAGLVFGACTCGVALPFLILLNASTFFARCFDAPPVAESFAPPNGSEPCR